ncbi:CAF17-like 4Fe-4S cluster assembly/insertion protein YgfZ [Aurantimonas marina]|uniref:CAF17-like 4Fe-4S cluster assembly/insertion protein YgfZ n=1 Tax=Aurantimonas marina TaxID=2780508 RepID=UPI0019D05828|nr:folate-binding protein YgfZ [Aurantimonas marina]
MPYAQLPERTVLAVTGDDADHFLQTLVTADLDQLGAAEMRPSALLTPQGKILFDFLIGRIEGGYRIDCALAAAADLTKRLRLYRLRSKVAIEPDATPVFGLWGEANAALSGSFVDRRYPEGDVARHYGEAPAGVDEADPRDYHALRVAAGIAEAETDYPGADVFPHDVLLDQNGGVSFKKGCFVGQEVVSRMQHRGTARRRLMLLSGERHLTPGANIAAAGKTIGTVLATTGADGFGFVRIDRLAAALAKGETLSSDGVPLTATIPPWAGFSLPEPNQAVSGTDE